MEERVSLLNDRRDATIEAIKDKTGAVVTGLSDQLNTMKEY